MRFHSAIDMGMTQFKFLT